MGSHDLFAEHLDRISALRGVYADYQRLLVKSERKLCGLYRSLDKCRKARRELIGTRITNETETRATLIRKTQEIANHIELSLDSEQIGVA